MRNSKIYLISLFFVVLALIFAAFDFFLMRGIAKDSEDLVSAKNKIADINAQLGETENFKKNYDSYKPNFEKIDRLFVDPENLVDFIEFMENTAADSQITSQISLPQFSSEKNQSSLAFQFFSKGEFLDILNFSKEIESGPYLIEIQNLNIQNSNEKTLAATFAIKAFVKPTQ